jgi:hypothetical protein
LGYAFIFEVCVTIYNDSKQNEKVRIIRNIINKTIIVENVDKKVDNSEKGVSL